MAWSGESWKPCATRQVMQQKTAESLQNVMFVCCLCSRWFIMAHDDIVSFSLRYTHNVDPFAIVICTCIHARMPGFYMIPCSWPPPPSGIGMVSESCWPNMMPNLRLPRRWKLNWVNWSSPWGMSKARVPPKPRSIVGLVVYFRSGESQMTGMTWVMGNRVNTYAKVTGWYRLMPDDLLFIWLRSESVCKATLIHLGSCMKCW